MLSVAVLLAAIVPPLAVVSANGLETEMEAVDSRVPPDNVTVPVGLLRLLGLDIDNTPALSVVPPEYVLTPDKVVAPAPTLVSDMDGPLIIPERVIAPAPPMALEVTNNTLPLAVAEVALLLYRELPVTPEALRLKLLELLLPFRSRAAPALIVKPPITPLSTPTS